MRNLIISLPTGTALPGGAVLPMSSVADFPMVMPRGTKMPGGVMVPVNTYLWSDTNIRLSCRKRLKARLRQRGIRNRFVRYNDHVVRVELLEELFDRKYR